MTSTRVVGSILLAILLPSLALAQQGGAPPPPPGGSPQGPGGGPGGMMPPPRDQSFFLGQAMRGIEEKADLLLDLGRTDEAIEALRQVYTLDVPKDNPFYEMKVRIVGELARTYAQAGKRAEALDTVKRLMAEVPAGTPAEAAAWLEAGSAYKKLGMADEALKAFDKAIELSKKLAQTGWCPQPPPAGGPRSGPEEKRQGRP